MSRLLVYGDSFCADDYQEHPSWTKQVSIRLEIPMVNKAISGSSTEYAFKTLVEDFKSDEIKPDDVIIFQFSSHARLHFDYQLHDKPGTASKFLSHVNTNLPENSWYKVNKSYIEWYLLNINVKLNEINHESYLHAIQSFAEMYQSTTFLILFNQARTDYLPSFVPPKNMFITNISLQQISANEQVKEYSWADWTDYTKFDPRINHLTNPNLSKLADLAVNTIANKHMNGWDYSSFQSKIIDKITNAEQYMGYVDSKILPFLGSIRSKLRG